MKDIYDVIKKYDFIEESQNKLFILKYKDYILYIEIFYVDKYMYSYEKYKKLSGEKVLENFLFNCELLESSIVNKELNDIKEIIKELNLTLLNKIRYKKIIAL